MTSRPLVAPARGAAIAHLALVLALTAGIAAAAILALVEPVADLLGEGAIRVIDVTGGARRGLIASIMAASTLVIVVSLWRGRSRTGYAAVTVAALVALFAAGPFALPALTFAALAVVVELATGLERDQLRRVGPQAHPIAWAAGVVVVTGFFAVTAYLAWFLVSPLIDEGAELDEALGFVVPMSPTAVATSPPTIDPAPTSTPEEASMAALISMGELIGADSFHFGSGRVLLLRDPSGAGILRFEDYEVRNGPDIHVFVTPDADGDVHVDGAVDLGTVRATRGNVNYDIPAYADLDSFRAAVIYCVPFRVVFATASLN
jgi:hypothetical protein